jgi:fructose-specific phosphotransferase system IIC component
VKRVALLGSSGGNLHRLGGSDPAQLIRAIQEQLDRAGVELAMVCFISADGSLDSLTARSTGTLWKLESGSPQPTTSGLLSEVNQLAHSEDHVIAAAIANNEIDGVILVSADPAHTNNASVKAAASRGLPAAGSGGSSVAAAKGLGVRFVSASGTTGTTNHTRAIGYAAGFAREWNLRYRATDTPRSLGDLWRKYDPRPILVDTLPAILAVSVAIGLCRYLPAGLAEHYISFLQPLILVAVAFTAAARTSSVGQAGMLAGVVAGVLSAHSGLLGALVGGYLAGALADILVTESLRRRWPATTANIIGSGGAGLLAGAAVYFGLQRPGAALNTWLTNVLSSGLDHAGWVLGGLLGAAMWTILLRGYYHSLILPLMVIEFSEQGLSFLAAVDMAALVAVSVGIALATIVVPGRPEHRPTARHTLTINLGFGTFVEGSFPHLRRSKLNMAAAVAAAAVGGAIIGGGRAYGVTYIPVPALPLVGDHWQALSLGLGSALLIALLGTLIADLANRRRQARDHPLSPN